MKHRPTSYWAQLDSGKLDCVILALVKESEAFIEVPLFDEPMLLAIYEDHPWANRECVPMADLAGEKLLMLEDGHCLRDQAMGFCFEAGADEDTHFRATSLETLRNMVAAGSGITLLPALAVPPERKRDGVFICRVLSRNLAALLAWFIVLAHRCAAAMSSWQRPSAQEWMAISIKC
ncbi:DNA-binding transcriptional regulator OxyR [Escherichia coli]|uniref:DNA-binding transcriptional regulator OxyR n=1 Tax=Escherichia coli TaxID=562 RepID=A0A376MP91_ECOLX|nr:DNA-binding transcriptional regulator OxyR [Escherichia coli]